jgi:hypothetical protein
MPKFAIELKERAGIDTGKVPLRDRRTIEALAPHRC